LIVCLNEGSDIEVHPCKIKGAVVNTSTKRTFFLSAMFVIGQTMSSCF